MGTNEWCASTEEFGATIGSGAEVTRVDIGDVVADLARGDLVLQVADGLREDL